MERFPKLMDWQDQHCKNVYTNDMSAIQPDHIDLEGQPLWKSVWLYLRKLDIVLPEDPAISLLGIYPEDVPSNNKDTRSTMFIAALFIISRS